MPIFGYSTIGSQYGNFGGKAVEVCKHTSPADCGTIERITAYISARATGVRARGIIYSDLNGQPGIVLAIGDEVALPTTPTWVNFPISLFGNPNTAYWIGIMTSDDFDIYFDNGDTDQSCWDNHYTYPTPLSPFEYHKFEATKQSIYATYTSLVPPTTAIITISTSTGGTTEPSPGSYEVDIGEIIQVTAIPASGYNFSRWLLDGQDAGSVNPYPLTMNQNHSLQAVFTEMPPPPPITHALSIDSTPIQGVPFTIERMS